MATHCLALDSLSRQIFKAQRNGTAYLKNLEGNHNPSVSKHVCTHAPVVLRTSHSSAIGILIPQELVNVPEAYNNACVIDLSTACGAVSIMASFRKT